MWLYFAALMLLLLPLTANAKIVIKIYGRGGIQIIPPAVCPQPSQTVCAEIEVNSVNSTDAVVTDAVSGKRYRAVLAQPVPSDVAEMQGSDLVLTSIEPLE